MTKERTSIKGIETLSTREAKYFNIMKAQSGVLYIKSRPGEAKSTIARSIAKKLDMQYMDIRLSMVDETDVGLYPVLETYDNGTVKKQVLSFATPLWAEVSNERPTIIHFEELNRAPLAVRNAALQILLERSIGTTFKFNKEVYMIASGNLGEEDGTDVEEFDNALNNRLWHVKHVISADEWLNEFANKLGKHIDGVEEPVPNVIPSICGFIRNNPEMIYVKPKETNGVSAPAYATPRSWTFLSDFIYDMLGEEYTNLQKVKDVVSEYATYTVGTSSAALVRYLDETMNITVNDILNNFSGVEGRLENANRDKFSELLSGLRERRLEDLKEHQTQNLIKFLRIVHSEACAAFITEIIDKNSKEVLRTKPYLTVMKEFQSLIMMVRGHTNTKK
jgi:hypothetical protein